MQPHSFPFISSLTPQDDIVIIGAGHGIGLALFQLISAHTKAKIYATFRSSQNFQGEKKNFVQLNPLDEEEIKNFFSPIQNLKLLINCVGLLEGEHALPEKSLRQVTLASLQESFLVNTCVTPLLAKHAKSHFPKNENSYFLTLSAKLASITENELGGWYAYRASKCALNMIVKTMAIEFTHSRLPTKIWAVHPGTTLTDFSRQHVAMIKHKIWSPEETAMHLLNLIEREKEFPSGSFLNWDGDFLPY